MGAKRNNVVASQFRKFQHLSQVPYWPSYPISLDHYPIHYGLYSSKLHLYELEHSSLADIAQLFPSVSDMSTQFSAPGSTKESGKGFAGEGVSLSATSISTSWWCGAVSPRGTPGAPPAPGPEPPRRLRELFGVECWEFSSMFSLFSS